MVKSHHRTVELEDFQKKMEKGGSGAVEHQKLIFAPGTAFLTYGIFDDLWTIGGVITRCMIRSLPMDLNGYYKRQISVRSYEDKFHLVPQLAAWLSNVFSSGTECGIFLGYESLESNRAYVLPVYYQWHTSCIYVFYCMLQCIHIWYTLDWQSWQDSNIF